jgi:hypothetical protein
VIEKTAYARVPYNFKNTSYLPSLPNTAEGGGSMQVQGNLRIGNRVNNTVQTGVEYKTKVPQVQYRVSRFIIPPNNETLSSYSIESSTSQSAYNNCCPAHYRNMSTDYTYNSRNYGCNIVMFGTKGSESSPLNENANCVDGGTGCHQLGSEYIDIPDLPIGSQVCFGVSIFPAETNGDTDMSGTGRDWYHSAPKCVVIGKKPKVQVKGAGLFVRRNAITSQTVKNGRAYGSFVEYEAVIGGCNVLNSGNALSGCNNSAIGRVGLGSAAAFMREDAMAIPMFSRQTFTNNPSGTNYNVGKYSAANSRASLAGITEFYGNGVGGVDVDACEGIEGNCEQFAYTTNENIGGFTMGVGSGTRIYRTTGTFTITDNIMLADGTYSSLDEIPQVLIFADQGVNIMPNVTRVDAWIITPGGVLNTCYIALADGTGKALSSFDGTNIDDCSGLLTVNGATVAGSVLLNRTGGSGVDNSLRNGGCSQGIDTCGGLDTGNRDDLSGDPAEVFNLRADAYLFSRGQSTRSGHVQTTYVREVAPRL